MDKYLKFKDYGPVGGDCTGPVYFELVGNPTVKELADSIISDDKEWGYIGIYDNAASPNGFVSLFGNPHIEYRYGQYVDENYNPIEFNFPEKIANSLVKEVKASGGWSRMDWLFVIK